MEVSMPCLRSALASLAVSLFFPVILLASDPPNFGGSWEMDTAKSQVLDGRVIVLNIESVQKKLKVVELVRDKTGKELSYQFVCETSGGQCDFDEGGHKSKVSLWYNGPALVVLKTDGQKEDASNEWTMKLSPGSKILTVDLEHIDPAGKNETLVFNKKP